MSTTNAQIRPRGASARVRGVVARVVALSIGTALASGTLVTMTPAKATATNTMAPPAFGAQFHGTWADYTDESRARVLDTLAARGASTVRIDVSWNMLEPAAPGTFDAWGLSVVDKAIHMAAERGMRPLVTLWMAPQWANGSSDERVPPTTATALDAYTDLCERLAARYAGVVDGWEIWNEPNSDDFMRGADPVVYANILKAAYAGFKSGDENSLVVFGGPMYTDDAWVDAVLSNGGAGQYDVMAVHPYMGVADEAPDLPDNGTIWRMNHLPAVLSVMDAHGDGGKPVWFTEFGWSVHPTAPGAGNWERGVTAEQAADYLKRTYALITTRYPQVRKVFWYQDRTDGTDPATSGYGLVFPDGSSTKALAAVAALVATPHEVPAPSDIAAEADPPAEDVPATSVTDADDADAPVADPAEDVPATSVTDADEADAPVADPAEDVPATSVTDADEADAPVACLPAAHRNDDRVKGAHRVDRTHGKFWSKRPWRLR